MEEHFFSHPYFNTVRNVRNTVQFSYWLSKITDNLPNMTFHWHKNRKKPLKGGLFY